MGTLDDAIREHLELKRKRGSSEEELARKEDEAFKPGGPAAEASMTEGLQESASAPPEHTDAVAAEPVGEVEAREPPTAPEVPAAPEPPEPQAAEAESGSAEAAGVEQADAEAAEIGAGEIESDQVLPEETLEAGPPVAERVATPEPVDEWLEDEPPADRIAEGQDPLEEIPDFLEDTVEQEHLWFEQKSPKEFDFGD